MFLTLLKLASNRSVSLIEPDVKETLVLTFYLIYSKQNRYINLYDSYDINNAAINTDNVHISKATYCFTFLRTTMTNSFWKL